MNNSSAGSSDPRRFELSLKIPARDALDHLSSRVRAERPLALLATGDWSEGYVGVFNGHDFRIRRATNIPRLYTVQAYGSVRDQGDGSILNVRFRRNRAANAIVWFARVFFVFLIGIQLLAATRQPVFLVGVAFLSVVGGMLLWNARERESDRRLLRSLLSETFANSTATPSPRPAR